MTAAFWSEPTARAALRALFLSCVLVYTRVPTAAHAQERARPMVGIDNAATVRIYTEPQSAHAYLTPSSSDEAGVACTRSCALHVPPGAYRIRGGFLHADLVEAKGLLDLRAGHEIEILVRIEARTTARWLVPLVGAVGFLLMVSGIAWGIQQSIQRGSPLEETFGERGPASLFGSGGGMLLVAVVLALVLSESPRVMVLRPPS